METLFGILDDSEEGEDAAYDFQSLLWTVKIDEESYLEIVEKCRLRRLLRQANYGVEESMNKLFAMMDTDGNGKVTKHEYQEWYKKVVEIDSEYDDDFDDADFKKKFERKETQKMITDDFKALDLDGDGSITMTELIEKLNPSASISEKEKLAEIVSSAPNFDLGGDGIINMSEMITKSEVITKSEMITIMSEMITKSEVITKSEMITISEMITKSSASFLENNPNEEKGPVDYIEMKKMYQKQFNTKERARFLKEFDLNKDGYVTMKEIKQRIQEKGVDFFEDVDSDGEGNIPINEMITKLNPKILEKKITEKKERVMRRPRHYGYLDPTLASKAKERKKSSTATKKRSYLEKIQEPQLQEQQVSA
jgi:Ca2+-binding EF-hand superfamily protein